MNTVKQHGPRGVERSVVLPFLPSPRVSPGCCGPPSLGTAGSTSLSQASRRPGEGDTFPNRRGGDRAGRPLFATPRAPSASRPGASEHRLPRPSPRPPPLSEASSPSPTGRRPSPGCCLRPLESLSPRDSADSGQTMVFPISLGIRSRPYPAVFFY